MWPFKKTKALEKRSSATGYTAQIMQARAAYIASTDGLAELTGTVQGCVSLWEGGLSLADVDGTDMLTPFNLGLAARALALRGEAVFAIRDDGLVPCSDWDLTTRFSTPTAYRVGIPDTGGGRSETLLASEVLHLRVGAEVSAPYTGVAPLRRARLTGGLLETLEVALSEVYSDAPLGSAVIPMPEQPDTDMTALARGFRGMRGRVLVRESVNVTAAGGPAPQTDLKPHDVTPDLSKAMMKETLEGAKASIQTVFGVLPALGNPATTGPMARECERHLAQWTLQPIAQMIAREASDKLGSNITLDVMRPLQAFDTGGRARALAAVVQTLALAKEQGVDAEAAMRLVDWSGTGD
ncbi:MAG: hypothetical protein QNI87_12100 [Erythrobacter sp.]|uniref:phage portal protein n=1 Tax=Erythrobacter sp. TaxID=1042 RepID=UPI002602F5DC|nr:hypothetical protein [Erythrobacter sp.]MDJ0979259.1 hypothetical protein [Erythrobacter sp.]